MPDDDGGAGRSRRPLRLDLYSEEPVLDRPQPRLVRETGVEFGEPRLLPFRAQDLPGAPMLAPGRKDRILLLVQFPFDLEALPDNRWYESATVTVDFPADVIALDIRPAKPTVRSTGETYLLDVRGVGRRCLAWDLRASEPAKGLRPRSHVMQAVVECPPDIGELSATVNAKAVIGRKRLGTVDRFVATTIDPKTYTLGPVCVDEGLSSDRAPSLARSGTPGMNSVIYPGPLKVEVCRRLTGNWKDLADYVGVPLDRRSRFEPGREPYEVWEWLELQGRLGELPEVLRTLGREDLADLLDDGYPRPR